jgi:CRP/FNR family transcriptional regulator, nitrogen fixation regulation protein
MQFALATAGLAPLLNAGSAPHLGPRQEAGVGSRRRFEADEEIYAEGDRAAHFYKVVSGAVRTYKLLDDGRRQIAGFHLPGDIFGVEAGEEHRFGAEAVTETTLAVHRRSDREALARDGGALAREVVAAMMGALDRAQEHMILLGRKSAKERIASFLLGLAERTRSATAVEGVSRSLTQLERAGIIELPTNRRMVVLRDKATLRRLDA